jgi:hypothetical protein
MEPLQEKMSTKLNGAGDANFLKTEREEAVDRQPLLGR